MSKRSRQRARRHKQESQPSVLRKKKAQYCPQCGAVVQPAKLSVQDLTRGLPCCGYSPLSGKIQKKDKEPVAEGFSPRERKFYREQEAFDNGVD